MISWHNALKMHEQVTEIEIWDKLTHPPTDSRLISLVNEGRIERTILTSLIRKYISVKDPSQFEFRFIGKGNSRCVVLLLLQNHFEDPLVIKCGQKELIAKELEKFDKSLIASGGALALSMSDRIRPSLRGSFEEYLDHRAIAFEFPRGCKSVETIQDCLRRARLTLDELVRSFGIFSRDFARWQRLKTSVALPFGRFEWRKRDLERVPEAIAAYKSRYPSSQVELLLAVMKGEHSDWRDKLQNVKCTAGSSHGDLNLHNLLVGRDQNGIPNWYVIDFFSASRDCHSPAIDWAKIERDIKLRALRDVCKSAAFRRVLEPINDRLRTFDPIPAKSGSIGTCTALLNEVRRQYTAFFNTDTSDIPRIEYLYYLLCWNLSYCGTAEFQQIGRDGNTEIQDIVVESAIHTFDILNEAILNFGSPVQPKPIPHDTWSAQFLRRHRILYPALSALALFPICLFIWFHHPKPKAALESKASPVRILVTTFEPAPGTPMSNVSGAITAQLFQSKSPHDELEIERSDVTIRLGRDGEDTVQSLGRERNADAVVWGSYEIGSGATEGSVDIHFDPISKRAKGIRITKTSSFAAFPVAELSGFTAKAKLGSRMSALAMMILGWSRAERGDSVGAIDAFTIAADQKSFPDNMIDPGLVYQYRARQRSNLLQFKEAINDLSLAIEKGREPDYVSESIGLRAIEWTQLRKRDETVKDCNRIRNLTTASSSAFNYCAVAYRFLGDSRASAFFVTRAIQTSHFTGVMGHLYLKYLYAQLCDYAQSKKEYAEAVRIGPKEPELQEAQRFFGLTHEPTSVQPEIPMEYELQVNSYLSQGRNDLAANAAEKALQSQPVPQLWFTSAKVHMATGDFTQALTDLDRMLPSRPSSSAVYVMKSRLFHMLHRKKEAEDAVNDAIAVDSTDAAAYSVRAQLFLSENKVEPAITDLHKALDLEPSYSDAYRWLGEIALSKGQFGQALLEYEKAIRPVADLSRTFYLQAALPDACFEHEVAYRKSLEAAYRNREATIAALSGRLSLASHYLERSKKLDSTNPYTFYLSSQLAAVTHQNSLALQEIAHAIELNPKIPDTYMQQGNLLLNANGWKAALQSYDKALKIAPAYIGYVQRKCHVLKRLDAFTCFSDLIARFPDRRELYLDRTVVQITEEDIISDLSAALRLREDAGTLLNRSMRYRAIGDWEKALLDLNRSIQLQQWYVQYWQRNFIKQHLGDWTGAEEDVREAMRRSDEKELKRSEAYLVLAEIAAHSGKLYDAIENADAAIKHDKEFATGYEFKADILIRQQRFKDAAENYSTALAHLRKSQSLDTESLQFVPVPVKRKSLSEKLKAALASANSPNPGADRRDRHISAN